MAKHNEPSSSTPASPPTEPTELEVLKSDLERAKSARIHTQDWYAAHYGKLEDWARKRLPEPWVNEFFSCVANGTWGHDDVGEPYMSQVGRIVPSGYLKMETAVEQLLHDQTTRAENAEMELASVRAASTGTGSRIEELESACALLRAQIERADKVLNTPAPPVLKGEISE